MHLITALGMLLLISSIVVIVQESKDNLVRTLAIIGIVLGAIFSCYLYMHVLRDLAPRQHLLYTLLAITAAIDGLLLALKTKNRVAGTCTLIAGAQLALIAMGIIDL